MNRIVERFSELKSRNESALIVYLTAGDPNLDETAGLVMEAARGGADVIELGVPFSDPSADGPVIQQAMTRALSSGGLEREILPRVLDTVRRVRKHTQVPIVLFGYFNPLLQRGLARVAGEAAEAGVDGLLVVDLPPEESEELDGALAAHQLVRVPLLSPTTSTARARTIVARGGGFAYYVALTGVTGAGHLDPVEVEQRTGELRSALGGLPLAVGFGIKDPAGAAQIARFAEGVVVGSALVQAIASGKDANARKVACYMLVKQLYDAVRARKA
jgi:tryptophan synthase alpha chain